MPVLRPLPRGGQAKHIVQRVADIARDESGCRPADPEGALPAAAVRVAAAGRWAGTGPATHIPSAVGRAGLSRGGSMLWFVADAGLRRRAPVRRHYALPLTTSPATPIRPNSTR